MSLKTNLFLDSILLVAFLVSYETTLTGIAVHEWLCIAFFILLLVHLLFHWDWVVSVMAKFFRKLFHQSRLNFVVDLLALVMFMTVMVSGIMISRSVLPFFGLQGSRDFVWRFLHSSSADLLVFLIALHFALHWKWIVYACKRYVFHSIGQKNAARSTYSPVAQVKDGND